jgi:chromosome segregation ATPase
MRGSDSDWPVAAAPERPETAPEAAHTGGSRMLLDDLMAERGRAHTEVVAPPVLTVEPVAVPPTGDVGRREARQRLLELEDVARRNFRSAEEARRVLLEEHRRLEDENSARAEAEREASALRRELERLRESEEQRDVKAKARAARDARAEMADEVKRIQDQHESVVHELDRLRGTLGEHDGLLEEYNARLREEQQARAALRKELDRAEASRELAERAVTVATEDARRRAEDERIRLATAEAALADAVSDRDRFAARIEELTAGDGAIGRLNAELGERDDEIARLNANVVDLTARLDATEEAAQGALRAQADAEARVAEIERVHSDKATAADAAGGRIAELEAAVVGAEAKAAAAEERAREAERQQGRMRREASELAKARRASEEAVREGNDALEPLRAKLAETEAELVRARADGDRLRAHAAELGDELSALRASVTELQSAAPAPMSTVDDVVDEAPDAGRPALERRRPHEPGTAEPAIPGVRRHAMAELTAIAATVGSDERRR